MCCVALLKPRSNISLIAATRTASLSALVAFKKSQFRHFPLVGFRGPSAISRSFRKGKCARSRAAVAQEHSVWCAKAYVVEKWPVANRQHHEGNGSIRGAPV